MACIINADNGAISGSAGVKTTADSTGVLNIQTNGTTAISISASQAVSFTNTPTFTGGTANGVLYLNGSKVATSGTALVFDGTNLGIGTTSPASFGKLAVVGGNIYLDNANGALTIRNADLTNQQQVRLRMSGTDAVLDTARNSGAAPNLIFGTESTERMRLTDAGNLGIGTSSPSNKLNVSGNGYLFALNGGLTNRVAQTFGNTGGGLDLGIEGSAGGTVFTGGSSYAGVIGTNNATALQLGTNGTIRATLDSSGNLGIGTSSPSDILTLAGGASGSYGLTINNAKVGGGTKAIFQYDATNAIALVGGNTTNGLAFQTLTGGSLTTKATIDSSGNLGLGVTPSAWSSFKGLQVGDVGAVASADFGGSNVQAFLGNNVYYGSGGFNYIKTNVAAMYRMVGGAHQWNTAVSGTANTVISFTQAMTLDANGNFVLGTTSALSSSYRITSYGGRVNFAGNNDALNLYLQYSNGTAGVFIGSPAANVLAFSDSNGTERARITAAGALLVGTTTIAGLGFSFQGNGYYDQYVGDSFGPNAMSTFYSDSGATKRNVAIIRVDGNIYNFNGVYGTLSDAKLKENIVDAKPKLESLCKVRVVNYNKIGDSSKHIGVIAQELEQVFPSLVDETPDRDAKGNDLGTTTKSVKYSVFVPMLIKAMQEQQAMINELMAKVAALESK
jgi:hypothetical protein